MVEKMSFEPGMEERRWMMSVVMKETANWYE